MMLYGHRKISKKEISKVLEQIPPKNVCYLTTEKTKPVVFDIEGNCYYINGGFEFWKEAMEKFKGFHTVDRCYCVNLENASYYQSEWEILWFEHSNHHRTSVTIAKTYKEIIEPIIRQKNIRIV